jgi:hypothetical protein
MTERGQWMGARGRRSSARTAVALALMLALTGCVPGPEAVKGAPAPTPSPSFTAAVGDEIVLINCAMFVPLDDAAEVLGLAAGDIIDQHFPPATASNADGVTEAMAVHAGRVAGGHQCRYVRAGAGEGNSGPKVLVTVLPDAVAEFDAIQPDMIDGSITLVPAELGDRAFSACHDGEWPGCRAEVLTGTTWLSISVAAADLDPADFQAYGEGVVESLGALKFAHPAGVSRPDCDALVSPHDLSGAGAMLDPTGGDLLALGTTSSQATAMRARGGLVSCSWSGSDASIDAGGSGRNGMSLTILPNGGSSWRYAPPADIPSSIALEPLDLAADADADWLGSGVEALGGCADGRCQVTLLAGDAWVTVTTTGTAGLPGARALAEAASIRYAATL